MSAPTTTRTVIPALPGFDVVELRYKPYELAYIPIIAWIVAVSNEEGVWPAAEPVCVDWSSNDPNETSGIRQRNGDIIFIDSLRFAKGSEAEALACMVKNYERDCEIKQGARDAWNAKSGPEASHG